jgi:hypothetical protein
VQDPSLQASLPSLRKQGPISNTLSIPPIIRRLSQSSGAILSDSLRFVNSVAVVSKGRADAPPAEPARIGVSTSMKPSDLRKSRIFCIISDLSTSVATASLFVRSSTCLSRVCPSSGSPERGTYSSTGKWCRQGARSRGSWTAFRDSWPDAVR